MAVETASEQGDVSSVHQSYVKEIYILVLGLGFAVFAMQFITSLVDKQTFKALQLVYFSTIYYFMAYEWVAYALLTAKYPYKISARAASQGRFYADLAALVLKAGLIFVAAEVDTIFHLLFVVALFLAWHLVILVWLAFARRDWPSLPSDVARTHQVMVGWYATCAVLLLLVGWRLPTVTQNPLVTAAVTAAVCLVIAGYATWRKRELILKLAG